MTTVTPTGVSRRGFIGRTSSVLLMASMASVATAQRAKASCAPPTGCYGYDSCGCHGGGCGSVHGACCWVYTDQGACRTWRCCDVTCADRTLGICKYLVCNCC
jgi:hypothetical protein